MLVKQHHRPQLNEGIALQVGQAAFHCVFLDFVCTVVSTRIDN